jgi:hypothetical protein
VICGGLNSMSSMDNRIASVLAPFLCEAGLHRLICGYARPWTTLFVSRRGKLVLATTAAGTDWWCSTDAPDNSFFDSLPDMRAPAAAWCRDKYYRMDGQILLGTADLPDPVAVAHASAWKWFTWTDTTFAPVLLLTVGQSLYGLGPVWGGVRQFDQEEGCWVRSNRLTYEARVHLRCHGGHAVIKDDVYLLGGSDDTWGRAVSRIGLFLPRIYPKQHLESVLHERRSHCSTIVRNGVIYIVGGAQNNTVEWYDPTTETSTLLAQRMTYERLGPSVALSDDGTELYVIGGVAGEFPFDRTPATTIEAYSFHSETWRLLTQTCPPVVDCITVTLPESTTGFDADTVLVA